MTTSATVPPLETVAPSIRTRLDPTAFAGAQKALLGVGAVALLISIVTGFAGSEAVREQFLYSYLVAYVFTLSVVLGSMFFVLVQHLTRAGWSVVVRRVSENVMGTMPVMAVLFLPIAFGYHTLFHHWVDVVGLPKGDPHYDPVLAGKSAFLNVPFFFVRAVIYFAVWIGIAAFFRRTSLRQDETGDPALTLRMARVAAPCMLLYALTVTFAAVDWMMTLDPHWFSTIWGVYYYSGSFMVSMAVLGLLLLWLRAQGWLSDAVSTEHYHDVGKLMFAFVVFWTYIAFSQYMLIWYANLPEETEWFQHHLAGSWNAVGEFLMVGHFGIPFVFLMSRHIKRNPATLALGALFLMFIHWMDMYWVVMPTLQQQGAEPSWLDPVTLVGTVALMLGAFVALMRKAPLIPERDPRLRESLSFVNQ